MAPGADASENGLTLIMSILYSIWIALIGAERVDFFSAQGPFILTPFLILSPIFIMLGLFEYIRRTGRLPLSFRIDKGMLLLGVSLVFFLSLVGISVIFGSDDELGIKRYVLLLTDIFFVAGVLGLIAATGRSEQILRLGGYLGVGLFAIFSAVQVLNWLSGSQLSLPFMSVESHAIGTFVPRPSGMSLDPNRGGLLIVLYGFLILYFSPPSRMRALFLGIGAALLVSTLSKSAIIAGLIGVTVVMFHNRSRTYIRMGRLSKGVLIWGIIILVLLFAIDWGRITSLFDYEEALSERFSSDEASSGGIHLALLSRGFETVFLSAKNFLTGVGFGSSHTVLQDFYPGNKYANFHSTYISIMVESGIAALLIFLFIHFWPIVRKTNYLPVLLGFAFFNIFYQLVLEPAFWMSITLFWNNLGFESFTARGS